MSVLGVGIDVVILVSSAYVVNNHLDDTLLKQALNKQGFGVDIVAWDDEVYDFSLARLVIIRSCWDFDQRADEFFSKIEHIAKSSILVNSLNIMSAYRNKYYLQHLQRSGITIVPTEFATSLEGATTAIQKLSSNTIVVKPHVSASGRDTYRFVTSERAAIKMAIKSILDSKKDVMLQMYIKSVETVGERSTVIIDGEIIFTMQKTPEAEDFLVHEHHGGTYIEAILSPREITFIEGIIRTFDELPVYMRIDYLFGDDGSPMLLEVELLEPNLYFSRSDDVLQALTTKIIERLRQ